MEKKELEDIYNEFLDYANNRAEQFELMSMILIEMKLKKQLEKFDEMKDNPEWQKILEKNKKYLIKCGYIKER